MIRRSAGRVLLAAVFVLSGCAVAADNTPRDIDPDVIELITQDPTNAGQAAGGTGRIFLLAPAMLGESEHLQSVTRDIDDDVQAVLTSLLAGPNTTEFAARYRSGLPPGMKVIGITRRSRGVVQLNVDDAITTLRGDELILALAQIVYTLNDVSGVNGVMLTVDGAGALWPAGNGELQSDPLTVYDFPGLEPSTQPAYPAVPSGD
jgi:spore germination protein GerM